MFLSSFADIRAWIHSRSHWFAALTFLLVEWAGCLTFLLRARIVPEGGFFLEAQKMLATGPIPDTNAYPPLLRTTYWALMKLLHIPSLNQWAVYSVGFFLAGGAFYWLLLQLEITQKSRFWIFVFAMLNPYFIWLTLTSKDTALEACFSFLFFGLVLKIASSQKYSSVRMVDVAALLGLVLVGLLTRLTTVFPALLVCFLLVIFMRQAKQKLFAITGTGVLLIALGYCGIHAINYGSFSLSNNFASNFYFGNHPLYDYAHPRNDLDIFLPNDLDGVYAQAEATHTLTQLTVQRITQNPSAFAVRVIEKTLWHWFNFEKIPNLSSNTMALSATSDQLVLRVSPIRYFEMLPYLVYKFFYVPAFLIALFALGILRERKLFIHALLLVPLFALWPIVVLTFPDTRFKIVGEMMAVPFIWLACEALIARIRPAQT
ncbi:hypothetical protein KBB27_00700 [Patescibacteria group bacterium]|nr:hypothetical protein [Patescibacteria group bacterium]